MLKLSSLFLLGILICCFNLQGNTLHKLFELTIQNTNICSKEIDINQTNEKGETALHLFARYGEIESCEAFLSYGARCNIPDQNGSYPLHEAAWFGSWKIMTMLLEKDSKIINKQDIVGWSPLFYAMLGPNFKGGAGKCVDLLLDHKARIDLVDKGGNTIIHHIAHHGYSKRLLKICNYLSEKKHLMLLQKKNNNGKTALELVNKFIFPRSYKILKKHSS